MVDLKHSLVDAYKKKNILITGHTGFKGSWLSMLLHLLGANVFGISLDKGRKGGLYQHIDKKNYQSEIFLDLANSNKFREVYTKMKIDLIFHLAAQTSVLESITNPYKTWESNFFGTYNLLKTIQTSKKVVPIIVATTDKVYKNSNNRIPFEESFQIEGLEPYSQSKATIELLIQSFRHSKTKNIYEKVATARAGNVIGGGDWTENRIVPDIYRSFKNGNDLFIRNPKSIRPWQHVLEPLSGYLWLGALLTGAVKLPRVPDALAVSNAFNFGPWLEANRPVKDLVTEILKHWPGEWRDASQPGAVHEAGLLNLTIDKAWHMLGWQPVWNFARNIETTIGWYRDVAREAGSERERTQANIRSYMQDAHGAHVTWASGEEV